MQRRGLAAPPAWFACDQLEGRSRKLNYTKCVKAAMDQTKVNGGAPALSTAYTDTLPDEEEGSWLVHAFDGEEQRAMNSLTARLHEGLGKPRGDTDEVMLTRRHDPLPLPLTEASIAQLPQHIVASLTRLNLMPDEKREKMDAQVLQQEKSVKVGVQGAGCIPAYVVPLRAGEPGAEIDEGKLRSFRWRRLHNAPERRVY